MTDHTTPSRKTKISITGIILIFLGVVLLLQNLNLLPWGLWAMLWRLWPVLLIIFGINLIFGHYKLGRVVFLILAIAAIVGVAVGVVVWQDQLPPIIATDSALRDDLQAARVEMDFQAGELNLSPLPSASLNLFETVARGDGMRVDFRRQDRVGHLYLSSTWARRLYWVGRGRGWDVKLARGIPFSLAINAAAIDLSLDFTFLQLTQLDLELDAGNCNIRMPSQGVMSADITVSAANIEIIIPAGVAARIKVDLTVGSVRIDESRFPRKGNYYISPNFEDAENRISLAIEGAASRVVIK
ncbi:DUF5668 domain-containing protein [Candidatus Acetothermia bacterium]|nr:DUF5668 domain-containing protein [Candidatus Acetothermia bacterium]